jgi:nucleoside-diphosphate-sugar epimerase
MRRIILALVIVLVLISLLYSKTPSVTRPTIKSYDPSSRRFAAPEVRYEDFPTVNRKNTKVLITGGAGFIGSQLGYFLHRQGYDVILLDNMLFGYEDNLIVDGTRFGRLVVGDVLDERVYEHLTGVDTIFHFAALSALPVCQSNPRAAMDVNVAGVASMLEGARIKGVRRFIFASTSAVYEENKEPILTEDLHVSPHLLYSMSKQQAELLVRAYASTYDQDTVILRFFNVFGPHQDFRRKSPPFTSYLVRELLNDRVPIFHSDGEQKRDYVYVTDLMDLATRSMTSPKARGETFNVASGVSFSVNEMFDIVARHLRSPVKPVYRDAEHFWNAYPELFEGERPMKREILVREVNKAVFGSNEKAKELLGWVPKVSMEQGLLEMVKYIKQMEKTVSTKKLEVAWK